MDGQPTPAHTPTKLVTNLHLRTLVYWAPDKWPNGGDRIITVLDPEVGHIFDQHGRSLSR